jgi:hypothetical protein
LLIKDPNISKILKPQVNFRLMARLITVNRIENGRMLEAHSLD